ncbi:MAG: lysophospholipid acyltransferase family protein [Pseudomonadota bacterium]
MAERPENDSVPIETRRGRAFQRLVGLLGRLPLRLAHAIGAVIGWLANLLPGRLRRIARSNVAMCFPELDAPGQRRLVRQTLIETGRGLAELGWFWTRPTAEVLGLIRNVHGLDALEACERSGGGFILAAPHLGAWELLCLFAASRHPCTVLYREPRDPGIEAVINAGRGRLDTELVRAGGSGVRRLYRALGEGRLIGILPDQQPKRGNGVFVPFFGRPALTMVLLSRLAARADGGVVVAWAERLPRSQGFDLHFERPPEIVAGRDVEASAAALNATIERLVRSRPEQYQWGYKRFSIQPDGHSPY